MLTSEEGQHWLFGGIKNLYIFTNCKKKYYMDGGGGGARPRYWVTSRAWTSRQLRSAYRNNYIMIFFSFSLWGTRKYLATKAIFISIAIFWSTRSDGSGSSPPSLIWARPTYYSTIRWYFNNLIGIIDMQSGGFCAWYAACRVCYIYTQSGITDQWFSVYIHKKKTDIIRRFFFV